MNEQQKRWIPITKSMPETGEGNWSRDVLVLTENRCMRVDKCFKTPSGYVWCYCRSTNEQKQDVTHWMVLPDTTEM